MITVRKVENFITKPCIHSLFDFCIDFGCDLLLHFLDYISHGKTFVKHAENLVCLERNQAKGHDGV